MGLKMVSNKNNYLCRDTYRVTAKTVKHFEGTWESDFGPSGVRALPLAAGINVGGHSTWHYFSSFFFLRSLLKTPEGVVVGFQIFAWAPT